MNGVESIRDVLLIGQSDNTLAPQASASAWEIITSGGWPGLLILLVLVSLSIAAVYLVIDQVISLRRADFIPSRLSNEVAMALRESRWSDAELALQQNPSVLAGVVSVALAHREFGWAEMEKSVEDALVEQSAHLHRRIDYLSMIANLSPMVGLLGTVTGMIFAFRQVAATSGAAGAGDLAEGIYQALVTTVGGLIVAIPALAASGILRTRIDELLSEVTHHAEAALGPLRRRTSPGNPTHVKPGRVVSVPHAQMPVPPAQMPVPPAQMPVPPAQMPVPPAQMKGTKINSPGSIGSPPPSVPNDPKADLSRTRPRKST